MRISSDLFLEAERKIPLLLEFGEKTTNDENSALLIKRQKGENLKKEHVTAT